MVPDKARSDEQLVALVLAGGSDAFGELYRCHVGAVRRLVHDVVHDAEAVADVTQEVFARALEQLPSLKDPARFRPWLFSIARHASVDHCRARLRAPSVTGECGTEEAGHDPGPDELAELAELTELVRGCLAGLSARDATALALVAYLGFRPPDVAAALGGTPGAAKVMLHRARRRLRDAIAVALLVHRQVTTCQAFVAIDSAGDLIAAERHVRGCPRCLEEAGAEVDLYQATPGVIAGAGS